MQPVFCTQLCRQSDYSKPRCQAACAAMYRKLAGPSSLDEYRLLVVHSDDGLVGLVYDLLTSKPEQEKVTSWQFDKLDI